MGGAAGGGATASRRLCLRGFVCGPGGSGAAAGGAAASHRADLQVSGAARPPPAVRFSPPLLPARAGSLFAGSGAGGEAGPRREGGVGSGGVAGGRGRSGDGWDLSGSRPWGLKEGAGPPPVRRSPGVWCGPGLGGLSVRLRASPGRAPSRGRAATRHSPNNNASLAPASNSPGGGVAAAGSRPPRARNGEWGGWVNTRGGRGAALCPRRTKNRSRSVPQRSEPRGAACGRALCPAGPVAAGRGPPEPLVPRRAVLGVWFCLFCFLSFRVVRCFVGFFFFFSLLLSRKRSTLSYFWLRSPPEIWRRGGRERFLNVRWDA